LYAQDERTIQQKKMAHRGLAGNHENTEEILEDPVFIPAADFLISVFSYEFAIS